MRRSLLLIATFAALAVPALAQGTLKGGFHEDTKNGYKVKIPEKWEAVPIAIDEKWIVAKYLGDKALLVKKGDYQGMDFRPQFRVIVFTDEARKFKPAEVKVEGKAESRELTDVKGAEIPYKDYKDYLKRNTQGEGFFFEKEKETKLAEIPVWQYEVKFEKGTLPRRVIAWVFRGDAADYAVEYEVLEDHYQKFLPSFTASLQSFRFIKRESEAVGSGGSSTGSRVRDNSGMRTPKEREEWKMLSAKERAERRQITEASRFQRVKDSLPSGWTIKTSPHFLIVSHTDPKFTDRVVDAAEACRTWLDKNIGPVNDEYVMKAVIRVCGNFDEYRLFHSSSRDARSSQSREIVTYKDASMGKRSGFDLLFNNMFYQYLYDKDPLIGTYAPDWIVEGLSQAVQAAAPDGRSLKFVTDTWEADRIREYVRAGKKMGARQLMELSTQQFYDDYMNNGYLAARLVRHFLATKKDFVVNYLKAAVAEAEQMAKVDEKDKKEAATEEEEEAQMKERRENAKKRSAEMIQKVTAAACKWSDKEWAALESAYAEALK